MSLISLIIILALVGFALWAVNAYVPMQSGIKRILNIVIIFVVILWLLKVFGLLGSLGDIRI